MKVLGLACVLVALAALGFCKVLVQRSGDGPSPKAAGSLVVGVVFACVGGFLLHH